MSKKNAEPGTEFVIGPESYEKLVTEMCHIADFKPQLEPTMLRLARIAGLGKVEGHIMHQRKLWAFRKQAE